MLEVGNAISFPDEEVIIGQFWESISAFQTSLSLSRGRPSFVFYDGPPFATGLPHYGHILAGTIKDTVTRWAHQSGYYVDRRFGWDCHGLPVEVEIDKKLNISGPEDVEKIGIKAYNDECRAIVMRYSKEWETIVKRLGRWIDFERDYKTMYPSFMESVWWVFKQIYESGLVYKGVKVMPFSTKCSTPLSNFESNLNYKDVTDPAVIVSFPLDDEPDVSMIAWTTTPWTLPSNLGLCVHPTLVYVKITDLSTERTYIMMEERLSALFKSENEYTVHERFPGKRLAGRAYAPLFSYFGALKTSGAFRIMCDTYVTTDTGTGVVHQAPYFGEDDYRVCLAHGVITKDMDMVCPVDSSGRFTDEVTDWAGQYVKDADPGIIKSLKAAGRLVNQSQVTHSYPFCWRFNRSFSECASVVYHASAVGARICDLNLARTSAPSETPLIYKAVPSWFIAVEPLVPRLLENNAATYWVPDFVKERRFANWLRDAHDWNISRMRYWGTPIPIWCSDDGVETVCIGSIAELEQLTGASVTDLHRDKCFKVCRNHNSIDYLTIPSVRPGHPPLRRVSEVFDCWFESGSMPYAQQHFPFEADERARYEDPTHADPAFPAEFIAEGIDQTRGWSG